MQWSKMVQDHLVIHMLKTKSTLTYDTTQILIPDGLELCGRYNNNDFRKIKYFQELALTAI